LNINYTSINYQLNRSVLQSLDYHPTSYELKLDDMVITEFLKRDLEDEFHFICVCHIYSDLRNNK